MSGMEKIKFKGKLLDVEEFLERVFPIVPATKLKLNFATIKKYAADNDIFDDRNLAAFNAVDSLQALEDFIRNPKMQNKEVKELLQVCLKNSQLDFNEKAFNDCLKNHVIIIFDSVFDFDQGAPSKPTAAQPPPPPTPKPSPTPTKPVEVTIEKFRRILDNCMIKPGLFREPPKKIDITAFELTEKMPVTPMNDFCMKIPRDLPIRHEAVAIVMQETPYEIAAFGKLQRNEDYTHILLESKDINYGAFRNQTNFYAAVLPEAAGAVFASGGDYEGEVYRIECRIELVQPVTAKSTLCIDFGTSNTTVGTYGILERGGSKPEIVEFIDETGEKLEYRPMLPTIVCVDECTGGKIKYSFGYKALKKVIDNDYNPTASVFYEIKRWINDMNTVENITDERGQKATATHREILTAYLDNVIDLAEQHFKCRFDKLHFTAPVKLKDTFLEEMKNIFARQKRTVVESSLSIDEGIAIIYNHITEQMERGALLGKPQRVLIIDCGGGTTDLASCQYSLSTGYDNILNIRTRFESGDSNFGGNNVTFRILQLLKIKLADQLKRNDNPDLEEDYSVQTLIADENTLLDEIDTETGYDAYAKFDRAYRAAEAWVPTQFGPEKFIDLQSKLKRNFYYLWQMAEAYKIQFYRASMDFVSVDFNNDEDRKIGIPDDDKYYLFVKETADGELVLRQNPMSGIKITNNDIHRLLYADIYTLLKNVLSNDEQELLDYDHYKLSGQSCKITLFNELLKEFIPGKYLRYGDKKHVSPDSSELKLACIRGSIHYMCDTDYGEIKPQIEMDTPNLIYNVRKVGKSERTSRIMLDKNNMRTLEDVDGSIKIEFEPTIDILPSTANKVRYEVVAQNGKVQNTIDFNFNNGMGRPISTPELENDILRRTYDDAKDVGAYVCDKLTEIDTAKEGDVFALFAVPSKNGYGIYIYCVKVIDDYEKYGGRYHLQQEPKYYGFENNKLGTFFDGSR